METLLNEQEVFFMSIVTDLWHCFPRRPHSFSWDFHYLPLPPMADAKEQSITQVITAYSKRLFGFIRGRVRTEEDAQDILQDVWFQLSRGVDLEELENVGSWLFRTARNRIIDRYRIKGEVSMDQSLLGDDEESSEQMLLDKMPVPDDEFFGEVFWEELMTALDELPASQREVFVMNEMDGLTLQEIADETGTKLKTIISRKRYAVQYLRKRLKELYDEFNDL